MPTFVRCVHCGYAHPLVAAHAITPGPAYCPQCGGDHTILINPQGEPICGCGSVMAWGHDPRLRTLEDGKAAIQQAMAESQTLYSTKSAAAYLYRRVGQLRYWRRIGIGPHWFKQGQRVCYRLSDLKAWVREQR